MPFSVCVLLPIRTAAQPTSTPSTPFTQSITALAHLRAAVLYIVDISEQCGYTIAQQAALFDSVKPLFANKPLLIVANKVDVTPLESLKAEDQATLRAMVNEALKVSHGGAWWLRLVTVLQLCMPLL